MSRPRRIAYVLKRFPRISETFVAAELLELERQGELLTVFAISRPDEPLEHGFIRELAAPVVYLPRRPVRQPLRVLCALVSVVRRDGSDWLHAARVSLRPPRMLGLRRLLQATVLRREMRSAGIDHAHAHFATAAARLAHLSWLMGGPAYSVTAHAKDIYHRDVRPDRLREKLAAARFVATVTPANKRCLDALLGDAKTRCVVVPNSVDLRRLPANGAARAARPGVVVSVARLIEKKGLADVVEACGMLASLGVRLELIGDGPLRAALEARAQRAGAAVTFRGVLAHEQVIDTLGTAAAFCLPCVVTETGDRDGLPTSVLEAMALGVPVVTTSVNGLADLVEDGRTGLVVRAHDPEGIAAALNRILTDAELAASLAAEARARVESSYSLECSARRLRTLFPAAT